MAAARMVGCLFVLAALLHYAAAQTRHIVGDNTGWTVPSTPSTNYSTWAASKTFRAGDTLVFNFDPARHDVATVTKAAFDACNTTTNNNNTIRTSPATITLSEGEHYYICTFPGHCAGGQKLAINVTRNNTSSPPPTSPATPPNSPATPPTTSTVPPPGTTPTPPDTTATPPTTPTALPPTTGRPPSNNAPTLAVAGSSAAFLIAAAAILF